MIIPFLLAWPKTTPQNDSVRTLRLAQLDILGALLILVASTLLVFALDQRGSNRQAWNSSTVVISLVISAMCFITFILWDLYIESSRCTLDIKPIFPLKQNISRPIGPAILYVRTVIFKFVHFVNPKRMAFLAGFPFFIIIIVLPLRFQLLNGNSPTMAGIHILPLLTCSAIGTYQIVVLLDQI